MSIFEMSNLIVRNIDEKIVRELKSRAGAEGISAEAFHRKLLESALLKPKKKSFVDVLKSIPAVGEDSDFNRLPSDEADNVFN